LSSERVGDATEINIVLGEDVPHDDTRAALAGYSFIASQLIPAKM
jgi:hypothetical protein